MATIRDIARLAGVSHGTVSNVLNKRGNVSSDKIRLVEQAAKQLGYSTNLQAQRLRGENRKHVSVILPNIEVSLYAELYAALSSTLMERGYMVSLHLTSNLQNIERKCVAEALSYRPECIVSLSSAADRAEIYRAKTPIIFLDLPEEDLPEGAAGFRFDYGAIARNLLHYSRERGGASVGFFADTAAIPFDRHLARALAAAFTGDAIAFSVHSCDHRLIDSKAFELLSDGSPPELLIASNGCRADKIRAAQRLRGEDRTGLLAFSPVRAMPGADFALYELNYPRMAREIADAIASPVTGGVRLLPDDGVRLAIPTRRIGPPQRQLTMITLNNPTTKALRYLAPHFRNLSGIELKIVALPHDELYNAMNSDAVRDYDLIRMDVIWRNALEKRVCMELNGRMEELRPVLDGFSPVIREAFNSPEGDGYMLPLDPTTQLLFYRKDLFNDVGIKRMYYESAGLQLSPPRDLVEYSRVAAFFTRECNPLSPTLYGSTMTYGTAVVAACDFLPRLRGEGLDIFDDSGNFTLDTDATRAALARYVQIKQYSNREVTYWWEDSLRWFAEGATAMSVVFFNSASTIFNSELSRVVGKVDAVPVPGGMPMLGGGCIGVSRTTSKADLCMEFFKWLYNGETATLVTLLGGLTPCAAAYENNEVRTLYPWLQNIESHFRTAWRGRSSARYGGFDAYAFERILGMAVRNAALGVSSVEDALKSAQEECERVFMRDDG